MSITFAITNLPSMSSLVRNCVPTVGEEKRNTLTVYNKMEVWQTSKRKLKITNPYSRNRKCSRAEMLLPINNSCIRNLEFNSTHEK